jgi:lipopolysaccharide export system protein LptC
MIADRRRYSALTLLLLAALMALGSFWLLEVVRKSGSDAAPSTVRTDPDYYVEKFNFVRLSATGEAQYNISGKRMVHNPRDDTHTVDMPVVNSLSKERPPMTVRADRALVEPDAVRVHLYDNVRLDRPKTPKAEYFHMESSYLLVLPDDDVLRTDKPVRMTLGNAQLSGTGMVANIATGELDLERQVHMMLPPSKSAAP